MSGEPTFTRRTFVKRSGAVGIAVLGGTLWATAPAAARARRVAKVDTPIEHLIISCQENRSFDHYYGYAKPVQDAGFGPPAGYTQPDGNGGTVAPFEFLSPSTPDIGHSWTAVHDEWDGGAMDGFFTTDGINCMGFYNADVLGFYYSLFAADDAVLCANYQCSLLGPTWPNRFYFAGGTSGGITSNGIFGYGVFPSTWPIILDLLDEFGVTWKVYNLGFDSVPFGNTDNVFVFWENFAHDERTLGSEGSFLNDVRKGELPQVSWLIPSFAHHKDEHPPADVTIGMNLQADLIGALRDSPLADSFAFLLTYDEHGGYFDHVSPEVVDAYGLGVRVPLWVVSKWAKPGHVTTSSLPGEHTSTLKLIEALHGLPTLASRNHLFDSATPTDGGHNYKASGAPAPPRDASEEISNLLDLFEFS